MPEVSGMGWCPNCEKTARTVQQKPNHVLHALLTIFLCGTWGVVWLIVALTSSGKPRRCAQCGVPALKAAPQIDEQRRQRRAQQAQKAGEALEGGARVAGRGIKGAGKAFANAFRDPEEVAREKERERRNLSAVDAGRVTFCENCDGEISWASAVCRFCGETQPDRLV